MSPLPINQSQRRRASQFHVDGTRHRRFSTDQPRRAWYARHRAQRYARFLHSL